MNGGSGRAGQGHHQYAKNGAGSRKDSMARCGTCEDLFDPEVNGAVCNSCECALCRHCMGIECQRCRGNADRGIFETPLGIVVCSQCVQHCTNCRKAGEEIHLCPHCYPRHDQDCRQKSESERVLAAAVSELEAKEKQLLEARDEMVVLQQRIQKIQGGIEKAKRKKEKAERDIKAKRKAKK